MNDKIKAVLTCDIVDSSSMEPSQRKWLSTQLKKIVDELSVDHQATYLIYRGDSVQGLLEHPLNALKHAILIKAFVKSFKASEDQRSTGADIRVSIGFGEIDYEGDGLLESDGEAFHHSGRTLDLMKKKGRTLMLTTSDEEVNAEWDVILSLLEEVMIQWTIPSAEIVWRLIKGMDDKTLQQEFNISQPAVSQRKKYASWEALEKTLVYYESKFT